MDRKEFRKRLHTTHRQDFNKRGGIDKNISCPFKRQMLSIEECREVGSDLKTNLAQCDKLQCPISARLCWACLTFNYLVPIQEAGKRFCEFHQKHGSKAQPEFISISA